MIVSALGEQQHASDRSRLDQGLERRIASSVGERAGHRPVLPGGRRSVNPGLAGGSVAGVAAYVARATSGGKSGSVAGKRASVVEVAEDQLSDHEAEVVAVGSAIAGCGGCRFRWTFSPA